MLPPQTKSLHWPLSDPAQATGTLEEQLQEFHKVRDEIKKLVTSLNNYAPMSINGTSFSKHSF